MFVFTYLSAISFVIFLTIGFAVLYKNITKHDNVSTHFGLLLITVSLWCLANYQADVAQIESNLLFWSNLALIAGFFGSTFHVTFSYALRGYSPWRKWYFYVLPSVVIVVFSLLGIGTYTAPVPGLDSPGTVELGLLASLYLLFFFATTVATIFILLSGYKKLNFTEKNQTLWVLFGLIIMKIFAVLCSIIFPILGYLEYYSATPLASYAALVSIAIAIGKYKFLDIRLVIQRGVIYIVMFTSLATTSVILTSLITTLFTNATIANLHIGVFISLFLGLWLLPIADRCLRKWTNPWFFKDSYDYLESSEKLYSVLANENTVSGIAKKYLEQLQKILPHEQILLVSFTQKVIFSSDNQENSDKDIIAKIHQATITVPGKLSSYSFGAQFVDTVTDVSHIKHVFPITFNNSIIAVLLFGAKKSGEDYTPTDKQLITHLSQQLGVALQKAGQLDDQIQQAEKLEQEVILRTQQIKDIQQSQEKTMLDISHALQTPLTILSIESENLPAETKQSINKTILHVSKSVKELLTLARLKNTDTNERVFELVNLSALCELLSEYFCHQMQQKNIATNCIVEPDCFVIANYDQIEEVIHNIVENAVKYMPEQKNKEITVVLEKTNTHAVLVITDNGLGIPQSEQSKLFSRFYRSSLTQNIPGTGLGLAICKEIITKHSGILNFTSEPGKTTFVITLPIETLPGQ